MMTLALGVGLFVTQLAGCSRQQLGQLCSTFNGDDDCESGLVCYNETGQGLGICCPEGGGTDPRCVAGIQTTTGGGGGDSTTTTAGTTTTTAMSTGGGGAGGSSGNGGTGGM